MIKEKFQIANLGVKLPRQLAIIELKNHDLSFSNSKSEIYIFKILKKYYSLINYFNQESRSLESPNFKFNRCFLNIIY